MVDIYWYIRHFLQQCSNHSNMEFIHSSRGGQKLCLDGYMYTKQVTRKERVRWWCVKRVTNCKGAVSTSLQHDGLVLVLGV